MTRLSKSQQNKVKLYKNKAQAEMLALFSCTKEVSITPYLSKDQIAAAREMDLLTYLRRFDPEELVHIGGNTYATRTHDSLKISNGKWCWWSRNIGGTNALDYLTRVEGLSFLDAVQRILGELPRVPTKSEPTAPLPKTEFTLPPKHADTRRVFAYVESLPMARCAEHFRIPPLPVKSPAAISGFPLPFPFAPVAKPSACLNPPLTRFLT